MDTLAFLPGKQALHAYLFAHFIGEQEDGEQIYFAVSQDGLHWQDLNHKQPVLYSTVGERGYGTHFYFGVGTAAAFIC